MLFRSFIENLHFYFCLRLFCKPDFIDIKTARVIKTRYKYDTNAFLIFPVITVVTAVEYNVGKHLRGIDVPRYTTPNGSETFTNLRQVYFLANAAT